MKTAPVFAFLLLVATASSVDLTYATAVPEDDLWVSSQQTMPSPAEPGDRNVTLQLDLYHSGGRTYYNVTAEALFSAPFIGLKSSYYIAKADPRNTYTVVLRFDVAPNAEAGVYAIPLRVSYFDSFRDGSYVYSVKKLYVQVSSASRLEIGGISQSGVSVGSDFTITALVRNTGSMPAGNVSAAVSFASSLVEAVPSTLQIPNIQPHSSQQVTFRGKVSPYASNGGISSNVTLSYKGGSILNQFVLNIEGAPVLELYAVNETLPSGGDGRVEFRLRNTGASALSDLRVSLSTAVQLAMLDSSIYLGALAPGEEKPVAFAVRTDRSVKPGAYTGTVNLTYAEGVKSEAIGLVVTGRPTIQLAGSQTDITPYEGQKFSLSIQLENIGTADARSARVTIAGDVQGVKSSYVGTIDKDDTGTAVLDLFSTKSGQLAIPLSVQWVDNDGNAYSGQETITLYIYPGDSTGYVGILLFLVLAAAGYYMYRHNRKRAQLKRVVG